jgi:predicted metal-dependent HD superfamily phosphohydrolase
MSANVDLQLLKGALTNLRSRWPFGWPGLNAVLKGCVSWLWGPATKLSGPQARMFSKMLECASWAEDAGRQMHAQGEEPAYHNRLHTADTLVSCALLLQLQRLHEARLPSPPSDREWTCLLTMLLHDFGHDGRINATPHENERRSVALFKPKLQQIGFNPLQIETVESLVLLTEPGQAIATHQQCKPDALSDFDLMALLVTESDILASALPFPGEALTEALSQEWASHSPEPARHLMTPQGRLGFLQYAANFSSPASQRLGMQAVIETQVQHLRKQINAQH